MIIADLPQSQLLAHIVSDDSEGRLCFPQYVEGLRHWARDNGLPADVTPDDIVLAQIEDHGAEVFYSVDANRHSEMFIRRMPGCVRLKVGDVILRIDDMTR